MNWNPCGQRNEFKINFTAFNWCPTLMNSVAHCDWLNKLQTKHINAYKIL